MVVITVKVFSETKQHLWGQFIIIQTFRIRKEAQNPGAEKHVSFFSNLEVNYLQRIGEDLCLLLKRLNCLKMMCYPALNFSGEKHACCSANFSVLASRLFILASGTSSVKYSSITSRSSCKEAILSLSLNNFTLFYSEIDFWQEEKIARILSTKQSKLVICKSSCIR